MCKFYKDRKSRLICVNLFSGYNRPFTLTYASSYLDCCLLSDTGWLQEALCTLSSLVTLTLRAFLSILFLCYFLF